MYRAAHKLLCSHRTTPFIPVLKQSELLYSPVYPHPALVNHYATDPNRRPGFFESLLDNLKQEYSKSKEMKESLEKFREEAKKLEESDALKEARRKFMNIEGETAKSKNVFRDQITDLSGKIKGSVDDLSKNEAWKKASEFTENLGKSTTKAGESLGKAAENLSRSNAFKTATSAASNLKEELEGQSLGGRVYRAPAVLRKRNEWEYSKDDKPIEADSETIGVELHKDSRFSQSWQNFKDKNPMVNKFVDYRVRFEESDNAIVRSARLLTDKVQDMFGFIFTRTELSEVLTEIVKMDPNFDKEQFLKDCENDFIPNILEAMTRGDLEVLEDWCYEAPFNILATPIRQAKQMGYMISSKVLDIDNQVYPPVLCPVTENVMRVTYVWVMCRDQTELNPRAAWRLLDLSAQSQEQYM
ncbi:mitochondrial import inner membrane translocase subunit TIM44-like [Eurytemora carolleeae]|uniref:mitochondrial import inner membrane translocase subunit TIM44-like n=1 Tax=Eurytemora carolleeae TaxID=1294199 RepID=UPI000C75DB33|nr:mitochondrial import inner membrane translocase subunit TIM44-like [Eurytemora carolleeae]|eukprot:XP_023349719.1 mitochondrial import inner membrane translocase subunit TIM44-like [Eurytemora affinis]